MTNEAGYSADPAADARRTRRVDSLKRGDRFRCIGGCVWTLEREDASCGVYRVVSEHGNSNRFAGCAMVEVLP